MPNFIPELRYLFVLAVMGLAFCTLNLANRLFCASKDADGDQSVGLGLLGVVTLAVVLVLVWTAHDLVVRP